MNSINGYREEVGSYFTYNIVICQQIKKQVRRAVTKIIIICYTNKWIMIQDYG